jgi:hypothetical protein
MRSGVYRYRVSQTVRWQLVNETLLAALSAAQALYGEARSRLETGFAEHCKRRTLVIDATSPPGRTLARIFAGLLIERFGSNSVQIEPATRRRKRRTERN